MSLQKYAPEAGFMNSAPGVILKQSLRSACQFYLCKEAWREVLTTDRDTTVWFVKNGRKSQRELLKKQLLFDIGDMVQAILSGHDATSLYHHGIVILFWSYGIPRNEGLHLLNYSMCNQFTALGMNIEETLRKVGYLDGKLYKANCIYTVLVSALYRFPSMVWNLTYVIRSIRREGLTAMKAVMFVAGIGMIYVEKDWLEWYANRTSSTFGLRPAASTLLRRMSLAAAVVAAYFAATKLMRRMFPRKKRSKKPSIAESGEEENASGPNTISPGPSVD